MIKLSIRGVQISLGSLWLLDGLLQLQHQMFTSNFATQVITPASQGQPRFVSGPMHFGIHVFLLHPAVFNTLFAFIQLSLGALILWKRTVRLGLLLSIPWAFIVWVFGEGYGGIFSLHTLLLMGAPGAASIYLILAIASMPPQDEKKKPRQKQQAAYWLAVVWTVLWVSGGIYQLLPGQDSTDDVSSMIASNAQTAPDWLASADNTTSNFIHNLGQSSSSSQTQSQYMGNMNMTSAQMTHMTNEVNVPVESGEGYLSILLFSFLLFCIGVGVLFAGRWRSLAIYGGILLSLLFWVVGQSLGGYYTGLATDPNSGPLFVILGLAILGCVTLDQKLAAMGNKIQNVLIGKPR
jgi:hypothetical protein